jgi:hypothetical protein
MATSAPAKGTATKGPSSPAELVPPDESLWQRYSPHGEAPISAAASVALHVLAFGGLLLFGAYVAALFLKSNRSLPVEPVRLELPGGGGGAKGGAGEGPGFGPEDTGEGEKADQPQVGKFDAPPQPALTRPEREQRKQVFDTAAVRYLAENDTDAVRAYSRLEESMRRKLSDGLKPGPGEGGPGTGGGKGTGKGTGKGEGYGPGDGRKATLSQREKRMLRWHLRFPANSAREYLAQLQQLGAILAIPVREGAEPQYKIVRKLLARPTELLDEDVAKLDYIYWIDDKKGSVDEVMVELGVPYRPRRFVAFMPHELEQKLFEREKEHMKAKYGSFNEDRIYETRFLVDFRLPDKFRLIQMTLKKRGQR